MPERLDRTSHAGPGPSAAGRPPTGAFIDVGPTPEDRAVDFTLVLDVPGEADLQAYAVEVADSASAVFRRYLSADEIGARFGLPDADLERVLGWAMASGLQIIELAPQRTAISVRAEARQVDDVFGVAMHDFSDGAGGVYHAPIGTVAIPPEVSPLVRAIDGLDARPVLRPAHFPVIGAAPPGGMSPTQLAKAYDFWPLQLLGLDGAGQTVAIVSLDTFDKKDVAAFDAKAGISGPPVERIAVNGGVKTPGDGQDEVNLDIDVVRAIAPKAQILNYEAPRKDSSIADIIKRIVADGRADIVTISWARCEDGPNDSGVRRYRTEMAAAASHGITVYVASGDQGAFGCRRADWDDTSVSVDTPSSDPNVVAVGGTYLWMQEDGTYIDEAAWEEPLTGWGTGGGVSVANARPVHQVGLGVINQRSNGKRQLPDVAGPADGDSGLYYVVDGESHQAGGTSAAAPFWAGFTALTRQLGERQGVHGLGPLGKTLYAVAAAAPHGTLFHDVTRGGNLSDDAGVGWDYATGLGTPRGAALAQAIVTHLKTGD